MSKPSTVINFGNDLGKLLSWAKTESNLPLGKSSVTIAAEQRQEKKKKPKTKAQRKKAALNEAHSSQQSR